MMNDHGPAYLLQGKIIKMEYLTPTHQLDTTDGLDWVPMPSNLDTDLKAAFQFIQNWDGTVRYYSTSICTTN